MVSAPEVDDDHPDEVSYVPFEIAGLMTDASVAYSRTVAPADPSRPGHIDYLFEDMEQPTALHAAARAPAMGLAAAQKFSGQAVRSLYAGMEPAKPAPTQVAQR